jgi:intraflagellar transport protein 52
VRLAQLANKCTNDDLDYFVKECGDVLGVTQQVEKLQFGYGGEQDAKAILHRVLCEIVSVT